MGEQQAGPNSKSTFQTISAKISKSGLLRKKNEIIIFYDIFHFKNWIWKHTLSVLLTILVIGTDLINENMPV